MISGNESQHDVSPKALEGGFERRGMRLIGVDSKTQIHRYEADSGDSCNDDMSSR